MERTCARCGETFQARRSTARYCGSGCRARDAKDRQKAATVTSLASAAVPSLMASVRSALEAAERDESPAGVASLILAARIDAGTETGNAVAAMTRQLHASLSEALRDVEASGDAVDELMARRQARRGA